MCVYVCMCMQIRGSERVFVDIVVVDVAATTVPTANVSIGVGVVATDAIVVVVVVDDDD